MTLKKKKYIYIYQQMTKKAWKNYPEGKELMPFPYFVAGLLIEEEKEFQYAFYLAGELITPGRRQS